MKEDSNKKEGKRIVVVKRRRKIPSGEKTAAETPSLKKQTDTVSKTDKKPSDTAGRADKKVFYTAGGKREEKKEESFTVKSQEILKPIQNADAVAEEAPEKGESFEKSPAETWEELETDKKTADKSDDSAAAFTEESQKKDEAALADTVPDESVKEKESASEKRGNKKKPVRIERKYRRNKKPKKPDTYSNQANFIERLYMGFLDLELGKRIAKRKLRFIFALIACLIAAGAIYTMWENNQIETTFYQVQSNKVSNNIRVVCMADLHLKEFGKNNERLIERIKSLKPDIIACAGDMNTFKADDYDVVTSLCAELSDVAPIYYCLGNHEYEAWLFKDSKICDDLKKIGVKVLHNQSEKVIIGTSTLDIGGLSESPKQFEQYGHEFFDEYVKSDDFKLLLNHYPEAFLGMMDDYYVDLSLCGHDHGGQIRLPVIGGLYSADQGFFPKYVDGMHVDEEGGGSTFIVSRGLGNSSWMPRVNNRPELVVVDINWY